MKNILYLNAGAGSGKTFYLTKTFADKVLEHSENSSKGCTPSQVIMTTFSEKAAADIKRDARTRFLENNLMTEAAELDAANIGTVHAVAYKYIQKYWYLLGISAKCEVMTDDNKEAHISLTLGDVTSPEDIAAFRHFAETVNLKLERSTKYDYGFWKKAVKEIISKADGMGITDLDESRTMSLKLIDDTCSANPHYRIMRDCAERIFNIAMRWRADFEKYKKDNSIIEYNDMENYFLELLKNPAVQDEIRESVKYVFVDEFQDSNPKQLEIFDRLSDLVEQSYWVGDPKQAIYGFRACDTELVQALADNIRHHEKAGDPGFETDRLNTSRRSLEPLVNFTNDVFVRLFPGMDRNDVELEPYRTESLPEGIPNIQHWDGALKPGAVKANGKVGEPKIPTKSETVTALASEIRRILDGKSDIKQVFDKKLKDENEKPLLRDIRPSDIAILCRTNSDIGTLAGALAKYRIPVVINGIANAGRMEIRLVLLMLNYMLGDHKLLTAELAKLLCGLSLSDILEKDYDDIAKLTDHLKEYRDQFSDKGVASIVRGLVIRMNLLDKCAEWGDAQNRRNNLMALIKQARDYEANCLTLGVSATLEGFVSQVESGEIKVEGYSTEGVNIVTYHGSKGLQWPLVFLFSLTNDLLSNTQVYKSFLWDVRAVRKANPSADNLYPGYYLTYVPRLTNQYNSGLPDDIRAGVDKLTGIGNFPDFKKAQTEEGKRLLYVGVTRARDILVEVGQHGSSHTLLKDVLGELNAGTGKWEARTDKKWADNTLQEIWGAGTPKFFYREMQTDTPPEETVATTYQFLEKKTPSEVTKAKRITPAALSDEGLVSGASAVCLNGEGEHFYQTIVKKAAADDNAVGTCIHDIFAVYDPESDRQEMVRIAADTIARHDLQAVLTSPEAVITSAETLCAFLSDTYGKAVRIEHELPFREIRDGQMTVGSIDLVWFTSDRDCVLVDFKNLPGASQDVLNRENTRFLGHYAPQQKAYRDALTQGGFHVTASIIYLAMQNRVVRLDY